MRSILLLTAIVFGLLLSCMGDFAGSGGGSQTTNGVTACVLNTDGTPSQGSIVRLRRAEYVSQPGQLARKTIDNTDTYTDQHGRFIITDIDSGAYVIEVQSTSTATGGGAVMFSFSIDEIKDTLDLDTNSLSPLAAVVGTIDPELFADQQLYVQVKGLERLSQVETNGYFSFYDLPSGNLDLRIVSSGSTPSVVEISNVLTTPEDTFFVNIPDSATYFAYISIDLTAAEIPSSGTVTNFPMLIRLDSSMFNFSSAHPQGNDIRFSNVLGTPLPYEIEQWDPQSGYAAIWVSIDRIEGSTTGHTIVMSWGQTDAVSESTGAAVFDTENGFAGVWHLNENPSLGQDALKDRSANGFHGTAAVTMTEDNVVTGIAGSALWFNGINDSIRAGLVNLDGNYTLSCWAKAEQSLSINWRFIIKEPSYTLWYDTEYNGIRVEHYPFYWRGIYEDNADSIPVPMVLDTWYYIAATYDGDKIRLFVNGDVVDSTQTIGENPSPSEHPLLIGGRIGEYFKGTIDEVRVETVARSPEWIRLCYLSQKPDSEIVRLRR